ncbi:hypothetical protein CGRA01v4_03382 [Colletotrichum graminicola]|nr:hypothetical protein CGRA01v4_03382 [Colletotrichum graminicola]
MRQAQERASVRACGGAVPHASPWPAACDATPRPTDGDASNSARGLPCVWRQNGSREPRVLESFFCCFFFFFSRVLA